MFYVIIALVQLMFSVYTVIWFLKSLWQTQVVIAHKRLEEDISVLMRPD